MNNFNSDFSEGVFKLNIFMQPPPPPPKKKKKKKKGFDSSLNVLFVYLIECLYAEKVCVRVVGRVGGGVGGFREF